MALAQDDWGACEKRGAGHRHFRGSHRKTQGEDGPIDSQGEASALHHGEGTRPSFKLAVALCRGGHSKLTTGDAETEGGGPTKPTVSVFLLQQIKSGLCHVLITFLVVVWG